MQTLQNRNGFSLIELMVVVAIIGVLSTIGVPQYQKFRAKALQAEPKTLLNALRVAEAAFYLEHESYHSSLKLIGVAPSGRARNNVGFGSIGAVSASLPADATLDTRSIVEMTSYKAAALSFEDLSIAKYVCYG